jgi:hypothetical protein
MKMSSGEIFAGTPHTAYGKVFNSNGTVPANGDITFNSYITTRPGEVLTESSTGCNYSSPYWIVAVGNFPTAWAAGDIVHTDVTNTLNGETGSVEITMTSATASDLAPDLHLEPVVPVELSSFKVLMEQGRVILTWITETESNNLGFEILKKQHNENFMRIGFVPGHGTAAIRHKYNFVDAQLADGTYYYQLKQIDHNGSFELSEIRSVTVSLPSEFGIEQNYPNPFNSETMIHYQVSLGDPTNVELRIYNSIGKLVRTLVNEQQSAGKYSVVWDGRDDAGDVASSGIYISRLMTKNHSSNLKMIYMK